WSRRAPPLPALRGRGDTTPRAARPARPGRGPSRRPARGRRFRAPPPIGVAAGTGRAEPTAGGRRRPARPVLPRAGRDPPSRGGTGGKPRRPLVGHSTSTRARTPLPPCRRRPGPASTRRLRLRAERNELRPLRPWVPQSNRVGGRLKGPPTLGLRRRGTPHARRQPRRLPVHGRGSPPHPADAEPEPPRRVGVALFG